MALVLFLNTDPGLMFTLLLALVRKMLNPRMAVPLFASVYWILQALVRSV